MQINLSENWRNHLINTIEGPSFSELMERIELAYNENDICPPKDQIFEVFNQCSLENIKVVILGQDPYPTPGHAHGLSFSVPKNVRPLAKSLQNIFKELHSDLGEPLRTNGDLLDWVRQGVFLLNTVLTVKAGEANAHQGWGWEKFTDAVIQTISDKCEGVIFILWGNAAQKKSELIDLEKHHILNSVHPSPLSAYRGFFGSKPFSKTNELLALQQKSTINW